MPVLQAGDTTEALAVLIVAVGLVGVAILILFSRRKI
jgi:LPXTG-motif cell wall-anchored protein